MKCIFVYVTPNFDLGAICISCDLVAISRASSWLMRVKVVNAESTRDRYEITRDKTWHRDLYEASQTQKYAFIAIQTRHQTSQTAQMVARSDLTRATLPRPSSSTCESRSQEGVGSAASRFLRDAWVWEEMLYWLS